MVEVAGIEPASKDKSKAESTCLVVFDLIEWQENNQTMPSDQPVVFRTTSQTSAVYSYYLWRPTESLTAKLFRTVAELSC